MLVIRIDRAQTQYRQCQLPKEQLRETGWKGYREGRARGTRRTPETCLRDASWIVDGQALCTQHAGMAALEHLEKKS